MKLIKSNRSGWPWRFSYLPPILVTPLILSFKDDIIQAVERARPSYGLLPIPCLALKQSMDLWYVVPVVGLALFVLSFRIQKFASPQAIAVGYGLFSILLLWQLLLSFITFCI